MATIDDVSKLAGVSKTTVSRFINKKKGHMSAETERRIKEAIDELKYNPSAVAQSLKKKSSNMIGLVVHDMSNPFLSQMIQGVEAELKSAGTDLMLCSSHLDLHKEISCIKMLSQRQADGILLVGLDYPLEHILELKASIPIVLLEREAPNHEYDMLRINNRVGGRLAVKHLIERGHKKIAHVRGPIGALPAAERFESYCDVMEKSGIGHSSKWVFEGDYKEESGYKAMEFFHSLNERPTAVFFANDLMALGAVRWAQDNGAVIPEDFAIVGYDDIETASLVTPSLTTVRQPVRQLAGMATKILLKRILEQRGKNGEDEIVETEKEDILLMPELIVRNSG